MGASDILFSAQKFSFLNFVYVLSCAAKWVFYIDKTKKDRKPIQVNELSNLNSSLAGWQTFEMKSLEDLIL